MVKQPQVRLIEVCSNYDSRGRSSSDGNQILHYNLWKKSLDNDFNNKRFNLYESIFWNGIFKFFQIIMLGGKGGVKMARESLQCL